MYITILERGEWLLDKITNIEFDIDQSGNVRQADEAEALFCAVVICQVLKKEVFREEVRGVANNYDFKGMKSNDIGGSTFRILLNSWLEMQSSVINILVSVCKYKIADYKKRRREIFAK